MEKKRRNNPEEEAKLDLFSELPDSLIFHILGLSMNTKFAVQMCVLSKRWRNLWKNLFKDEGCIDLFSRCVNLEQFFIIQCRFVKNSMFTTLSSPRLVTLTISDLLGCGEGIIVSAPRLLDVNVKDINLLDHFELERLYQLVIKNIITKTKSLVLEYLGWKWIFEKHNDEAFIEIHAPKIYKSVATLTWKMETSLSSEVGFVEIFGKVGFVSYPCIIDTFSKCLDKHERLPDRRRRHLASSSRKKLATRIIDGERKCVLDAFQSSVSVDRNWQCNITRTWSDLIMWKMQWPEERS